MCPWWAAIRSARSQLRRVEWSTTSATHAAQLGDSSAGLLDRLGPVVVGAQRAVRLDRPVQITVAPPSPSAASNASARSRRPGDQPAKPARSASGSGVQVIEWRRLSRRAPGGLDVGHRPRKSASRFDQAPVMCLETKPASDQEVEAGDERGAVAVEEHERPAHLLGLGPALHRAERRRRSRPLPAAVEVGASSAWTSPG